MRDKRSFPIWLRVRVADRLLSYERRGMRGTKTLNGKKI